MDAEEKVIPLVKVSPRPSNTSRPAGMDEAKKAAQMILSCYPDYGKAPPEYIVNLIDVLATFPSHALVRLVNLREGIVARCNYLPSIAEVVEMGESFASLMEDQRLDDLAAKRAEEERARAADLLEKARKKYPTAFIDANGMLRYFPDVEKGATVTEQQLELARRRAGMNENPR